MQNSKEKFIFESSTDNGHNHKIELPKEILSKDFQGSVDIQSDQAQGFFSHSHKMTLTRFDIETLKKGGEVKKDLKALGFLKRHQIIIKLHL